MCILLRLGSCNIILSELIYLCYDLILHLDRFALFANQCYHPVFADQMWYLEDIFQADHRFLD